MVTRQQGNARATINKVELRQALWWHGCTIYLDKVSSKWNAHYSFHQLGHACLISSTRACLSNFINN